MNFIQYFEKSVTWEHELLAGGENFPIQIHPMDSSRFVDERTKQIFAAVQGGKYIQDAAKIGHSHDDCVRRHMRNTFCLLCRDEEEAKRVMTLVEKY